MIDDSPAEEVAAWLQLADGSWLTVTVDREALGSLWPLRFGLGLSVLTGGIALLAVWAARRVTVPLGRFAQAAGRLGTDVNAPPMAEAGPSEIVQAARAFNQMQERIQRLVDDRTRMLAAIAHDLRTVLTRLRLRAELIDDAEQQRKAIADLDAMATMLDETLAFARDDSAGEARQDVDLAALVRSLCDDLADVGQPVQYLGPDRLRFACRPVALRRALANLIDNAVKYGREAEVGLQTERDTIRLTIEDRGPGIPAAAREQVFQPFFRLEPSRSRATGGTGLGLAVARTIVHRHGGEIALDDRPGGGLVVRSPCPRQVPDQRQIQRSIPSRHCPTRRAWLTRGHSSRRRHWHGNRCSHIIACCPAFHRPSNDARAVFGRPCSLAHEARRGRSQRPAWRRFGRAPRPARAPQR